MEKAFSISLLISPSEDEIIKASDLSAVGPDLIKGALDKNTLSRIHFNEITAAYFKIPYISGRGSAKRVHASPAGVFCKGEKMVVVLSRHFEEIEKAIASASNKETGTGDILCAILYATALIYIDRLEIIDRETEKLENSMKRKVNNSGIFELMDYQRSLTAISTALKGLDRIMKRMQENRSRFPDSELLDDTGVAVLQATGMAEIFSSDLDALMDAFGSVLSNNVNQIMKILTSLTLIVAIPTMIAGLYGMNVRLPIGSDPNAFWIISGAAALLSVITGIFFYFRKLL